MQRNDLEQNQPFEERADNPPRANKLKKVVEHKNFQTLIIGLILLNGLIVIAGTYSTGYTNLLNGMDRVLVWIFFVEMVLKMAAFGLRGYFKQKWNIFDFIIVTASVALYTMPFVSVMRILRVLRLLRMISVVPALRKIIDSLMKSIPALTGILGLTILIFTIYAIIGTTYFSDVLPDEYFGSFHASLFTLTQVVTFESWASQVARPIINEIPWAWIYFESFIVIGALVILNLVVAVILNYLEQEDDNLRDQQLADIAEENRVLRKEIKEIKQLILDQQKK
ncbi:ion transporter [Aquibacillus sediminis]|uniref:ion transporter n=1 Tax=Aquibacillus sediminis TaxID=2574734 RepID=UPI001FE3C390|nr:ion transporter [Aquibacillus sediminis]